MVDHERGVLPRVRRPEFERRAVGARRAKSPRRSPRGSGRARGNATSRRTTRSDRGTGSGAFTTSTTWSTPGPGTKSMPIVPSFFAAPQPMSMRRPGHRVIVSGRGRLPRGPVRGALSAPRRGCGRHRWILRPRGAASPCCPACPRDRPRAAHCPRPARAPFASPLLAARSRRARPSRARVAGAAPYDRRKRGDAACRKEGRRARSRRPPGSEDEVEAVEVLRCRRASGRRCEKNDPAVSGLES